MQKKYSPIMIVHMILLIGLVICNVISAITFVNGFTTAASNREKVELLAKAFLMLVILVMLIMGLMYLLNEYGKNAAIYYKAFLILQVVISIGTVLLDVVFLKMDTFLTVKCILFGVKMILLLILAFWKDLGKQKTWIFFWLVLCVDLVVLVMAVVHMSRIGFDLSFIGYVTALVADGVIGLAIRGKYKDKEARGSK